MRLFAAHLLAVLLILLPRAAAGQSASRSELGRPYFSKHFAPEEYHASIQNWGVVQDHRGLIYVANNQGILEYDGASWRLIPTRTNTIVRALAVSTEGTVFVGMQGDFGYLRPDRLGDLRYVSLIEEVSAEARDFKDVWGVHASAEGVYFQTRQWLFRWDGREMKQWKAGHIFHTSFSVGGKVLVREHGRGLLEVAGDALRIIPGGEHFAELAIYAMMPYPQGRILIGTRTEGFLLYDRGVVTSFPTEADSILREHWLYGGCALPQGGFAVSALGRGVLLIDEQGKLLRVLDEQSGLVDVWVNAVYPDDQGGLWLALDSQGVMRINVAPGLTIYNRPSGLEGCVEDVIRHKGVIYAATSAGLFYLDQRSGGAGQPWRQATFVKVPGVKESLNTLASVGDELLVGSQWGIHSVKDGQVKEHSRLNTFILLASKKYPGRVYAGTKNGLEVLIRREGGGEMEKHAVASIKAEIRSMVEEEDGVLWLGAMDGDIRRLSFEGRPVTDPEDEAFGVKHGLPGEFVSLNSLGGKVGFATRQGIYRYVGPARDTPGDRRFVLDSLFSPPATAPRDTLLISEPDGGGNIWLGYTDRVDIARRQADGSYVRETPDVLRYRRSNLQTLYIESDGVAWLSDGDALLRYDANADVLYDAPFTTWIRRVSLIGSDSLIFGGTFSTPQGGLSSVQDAEFVPVLDYASNNLLVEFAAPSYNGVEKNRYQYYLEGVDTDWSGWTSRTSAIYTNLEEGTYRFHVRALNGQGHVSSVGTFVFKRLPPFYRTWWAYVIYLTLAVGLTVLLMHYRKVIIENRHAREQAEQLARERLANERLQQANVKLQEANERLQQADRLKDEFLTNTSHELRTPITAILGFTSVLKEEVPPDYHEFLDIIDENSKRLLHTVSSLLDLAKLKAGVIDMYMEPVDLGGQVSEVVRLLSPLAHRKQIYVDVVQPEMPVYATLDRQCLDRVLYNLIGNAIKFTEVGGITVYVEQTQDDECRIRVVDTGVGIEADFLPHLFEEFSQESTGLARSHEGSGLGLAITARLVKLMNGHIEVVSRKDEGSTFSVSFPAIVHAEEPVESPA